MTGALEEISAETAEGDPSAVSTPASQLPTSSHKRGRHFGPRPVDDPRTERIDLRVTPAQKEAIRDLAQHAGLSIAGLIVLCTLGAEAPRTRRTPGPDMAMLSKALGQIGKSGSNLNQIARRLNDYDFGDVPELLVMHAEIRETLAEHRTVCDAILRAVGV
jgi:hypothetical protein